MMKSKPILLLCPSVEIWHLSGRKLLDRKFYDGVQAFMRHWPGSICVAMRAIEINSEPPFGAIEYVASISGFDLISLEDDQLLTSENLQNIDVVLTSVDSHRNLYHAQLALSSGVPCIQIIEYTFLTRVQMAFQEERGFLKLCKTLTWFLLNEYKLRKAIRRSVSIQANGVPAFEAYKRDADALLYYDNRVTESSCITDEGLEKRQIYLQSKKPIRLAFSGRLIRAKGADALIEFSMQLKKLGCNFQLDIFGSGDQEIGMREKVIQYALEKHVRLHGAVDFESELLPYIQQKVDLFICCHRQGDPSCTYLETYGCGVPIAGFANEAHAGILKYHDVGWTVPMNDVVGLADLVAKLSINRQEISLKSRTALKFARGNLFEQIFKERMDHCLSFVETQ